ncbi:MAG TPA: isochorismate lyase [Myxococcaceae bacterium]|nr:isochorismate lyase [Myxococcaceae bacterium]
MKPELCTNLSDVRREIDSLDRQLISLLGLRFGYVRAAARFKSSPATVADPERVKAMLNERRQWAEQEGLSPDLIERLYRELVTYFTAEEQKHWMASANGRGASRPELGGLE